MRRVSLLRVLGTGLVVATGSVLGASGCADNDSSMFIVGVMAPESANCVFTPEGDATLLASGVVDLSMTNTYSMPLLVGNQLIPRGDSDKLRTETARIILRGAVVTLVRTEGNQVVANFTTNASGFVDPASGSTPGYGVCHVNAIPSDADLGIGADEFVELNVAVSVFGDTLGGDEIESATLTFPLFACNGCLVDCSTVNPTTGSCESFGPDGAITPCFPGQDNLTPCQYSSEADSICQ